MKCVAQWPVPQRCQITIEFNIGRWRPNMQRRSLAQASILSSQVDPIAAAACRALPPMADVMYTASTNRGVFAAAGCLWYS
jgi:hypothetical protein